MRIYKMREQETAGGTKNSGRREENWLVKADTMHVPTISCPSAPEFFLLSEIV
jgi:hypothetical protein